MDFDALFPQRGRWLIVAVAVLGVWWVFGRPSKTPILSNWGGETAAVAAEQNVAAAAPATGVLSSLFSKQQGAESTNLAADPHPQDEVWGNPLDTTRIVMTQGYGVGSHAPANVWGAVDLAVDGNGDGDADPTGTTGAPVYATQTGIVKLSANTYPAGNHIWVTGEHFKTGYSHLKGFAVTDGALVKRGDIIGYVGSTGESSGPHLDYQVWKDGVNVNPLDYGVLTK